MHLQNINLVGDPMNATARSGSNSFNGFLENAIYQSSHYKFVANICSQDKLQNIDQ